MRQFFAKHLPCVAKHRNLQKESGGHLQGVREMGKQTCKAQLGF